MESPTGTGKTISLLCSILSFINEKKNDGDGYTLVYTTNTYQQIQQAVTTLKELKKMPYYSNVSSTVYGSKEKMCTHPTISKINNFNDDIIRMCKSYRSEKRCDHYLNLKENEKSSSEYNIFRKGNEKMFYSNTVVDIEETIKMFDAMKICPYYGARKLQTRVVFMHYFYLFPTLARSGSKEFDKNKTIVVIDEAHHIDKVCEYAGKITIYRSYFVKSIEE
ncbi:uncharacterized protein B4U79_08187, partial [Dinothrombium tinctorium]